MALAKRKTRLDQLLVERGLFETRSKAQAAIMAGKVRVDGRPRPKAGLEVPEDVALQVLPDACPYVSRGGLKLQAALEAFRVDAQGRTCVDIGASTGGFTDCLLKRGAAFVHAVDVGHGQIDARLSKDARVRVLEGTHAGKLSPSALEPRPTLAVVDVSFISLTKILANVAACLAKPFDLIALIKPQFELEAKKTPKGIVRDAAHREEAVARVRKAAEALGLSERGLIESPITGAKGNVEFLIHLTDAPRAR